MTRITWFYELSGMENGTSKESIVDPTRYDNIFNIKKQNPINYFIQEKMIQYKFHNLKSCIACVPFQNCKIMNNSPLKPLSPLSNKFDSIV